MVELKVTVIMSLSPSFLSVHHLLTLMEKNGGGEGGYSGSEGYPGGR